MFADAYLDGQLYRLTKAPSKAGGVDVFFTEDGLHKLIEKNTKGTATIEKITQGQRIKSKGLRNRPNQITRLISYVQDSNDEMVAFERIVFKAKQKQDKGMLTEAKARSLAKSALDHL
jgi:peroxiredoxin family protein